MPFPVPTKDNDKDGGRTRTDFEHHEVCGICFVLRLASLGQSKNKQRDAVIRIPPKVTKIQR